MISFSPLTQLSTLYQTGDAWQPRLRALSALYYLLEHGASAQCADVAMHFQENPSALHTCLNQPQAAVRNLA